MVVDSYCREFDKLDKHNYLATKTTAIVAQLLVISKSTWNRLEIAFFLSIACFAQDARLMGQSLGQSDEAKVPYLA